MDVERYWTCYIDVKYNKNFLQMLKHNHRNGLFCFLSGIKTSVCVSRCYIQRQSKTVFVGNCHMVSYYSQGLSWLAFWSLRTSRMEMLPPQSWMSDWAKPLCAPPLCSLWSLHKHSYGRQGPPWRCRCLSRPSIGHPGQISSPDVLPRPLWLIRTLVRLALLAPWCRMAKEI